MRSSRRQVLLSFSEVEVMSAGPAAFRALFAGALRNIFLWCRGSASSAGARRIDIGFRFSLCDVP
jgi:hypothetical protein